MCSCLLPIFLLKMAYLFFLYKIFKPLTVICIAHIVPIWSLDLTYVTVANVCMHVHMCVYECVYI